MVLVVVVVVVVITAVLEKEATMSLSICVRRNAFASVAVPPNHPSHI